MLMRSAVLDDLVRNGLPPWVYTRRTVFALMFLGPLAAMLVGSGFDSAWRLVVGESRHAPVCFTLSASPLTSAHRPLLVDNHDVAAVQPSHDRVLDEATAAVRQCQPATCAPELRKAYRKAVVGYVSERAWTLQRMYVRYGDAGLYFAETVYSTGADTRLVGDMRVGFDAGLLDISRLHSIEQPMRMLLFRPIGEFKLCIAE